MTYFAYLLRSISAGTKKTYAGYSVNVEKRLIKHNTNTGARSTRGYKWKIVYKKKFKTKSEAMSYEYKIKKDKVLRNNILQKFDIWKYQYYYLIKKIFHLYLLEPSLFLLMILVKLVNLKKI